MYRIKGSVIAIGEGDILGDSGVDLELHFFIDLLLLISAIQTEHYHVYEDDHHNNSHQCTHTYPSVALLFFIYDWLLRDDDWLIVVYTLASLEIVRANGLNDGLGCYFALSCHPVSLCKGSSLWSWWECRVPSRWSIAAFLYSGTRSQFCLHSIDWQLHLKSIAHLDSTFSWPINDLLSTSSEHSVVLVNFSKLFSQRANILRYSNHLSGSAL